MNAPLSNVHRGVAFEERALRMLQCHLSMSLKRVGGRSDGGIDLLGWWWLPTQHSPETPSAPQRPAGMASLGTSTRRFRVFAQCKAEKKKIGPNYVREMEGVLHRLMLSRTQRPAGEAGSEGAPAISPVVVGGEDVTHNSGNSSLVGMLISESPFSRSTLLRAHSSTVPFLLLHLPSVDTAAASLATVDEDLEEGPGGLGSAFWNPALGSSRGLLGGEIELRWERQYGGIGRPGLWMHGRRIESHVPQGETEVEGGHPSHPPAYKQF
jgi:hypothetical protein